jgi:penicillin-insensitive murein endopeptidase
MSVVGFQLVAALTAVLVTVGPENRAAENLLPDPTARSISIGHPYYGKLIGGVKIPLQSPYHTVQRSTRARKWVWATPYLIRSLLVAAREVHEAHAGEPLVLGNLSKKGGGDIKMSRSHNTGRDVDYAYWTETLDGRSAKSDYHRFGDNGRSKDAPGKYRLDVARNWAFVRFMIESNEAELQYLITSPGIERRLLEYARTAGEPAYLIHRAERMMMLPGWAKPHDNHVHLRVLCTPADWKAGCNNGGPVWPWAEKMYGALEAARHELQPKLISDDINTRLSALRTVAKRRIDTAVVDVADSLAHPRRSVRQAALSTLIGITTEANAHTVLKVARLLEPKVAKKLIKHALPMAGSEGIDTAKRIQNGTHPIVTTRHDADLARVAERVLRKYGWISAILPGGP